MWINCETGCEISTFSAVECGLLDFFSAARRVVYDMRVLANLPGPATKLMTSSQPACSCAIGQHNNNTGSVGTFKEAHYKPREQQKGALNSLSTPTIRTGMHAQLETACRYTK